MTDIPRSPSGIPAFAPQQLADDDPSAPDPPAGLTKRPTSPPLEGSRGLIVAVSKTIGVASAVTVLEAVPVKLFVNSRVGSDLAHTGLITVSLGAAGAAFAGRIGEPSETNPFAVRATSVRRLMLGGGALATAGAFASGFAGIHGLPMVLGCSAGIGIATGLITGL